MSPQAFGEVLARHPGLETLRLAFEEVSPEHLEQLVKAPRLQCLNLNNASLSGEGLARLPALAALREIMGQGISFGDEVLAALAQSKSLERINGNFNECTDVGFDHLATLPRLQHLDLDNARLTPRSLEALSKLGRLEHLELENFELPQAGCAGLRSLAGLKFLALGSARTAQSDMTDNDLEQISAMSGLRDLRLQAGSITDEGLGHIGDLRNLECLWLYDGFQISNAGLAPLTKLQGLDMLALRDTPINDGAIPRLLEFGSLNTLDLSGTDITHEGLARLAPLAEKGCRLYKFW